MIHQMVAEFLGWSVRDAQSFSLRALRDLVRTGPASKRRDEIVAMIDAEERTGRVVTR